MAPLPMKHCFVCGTKLIERRLESEGRDIPFCPSCRDYRFPIFNTAVSMVVCSPDKEKILLIRQYGGQEYILTAGYVNKGEDAEDAARREIKEETGLTVTSLHFNRSHYFPPSNTLMLNFTAVVSDTDVHANEEVDSWAWFSKEEARIRIRKNSLAEAFLLGWMDGKYHFPEYPVPPYR